MNEIMKYLKYWYIFIITVAISVTLAFFYLRYATPEYKITSTLLIQDDKKGDGMLKGTAFSDLQMFQTTRTVDNEIEVLRSRDLVYNVLKSLSMETKYSIKHPFMTKELYGEDLPVKVVIHKLNRSAYTREITLKPIDDKTFLWQDSAKKVIYRYGQTITNPAYVVHVEKGPAFSNNKTKISVKFRSLKGLTEAYSLSKLSITPIIKDANTIILSLVDEIPQRGIDILNKLIDEYNLQNVNNKSVIARNTIKFIDNRLKYLTADLAMVEQDVENYKRVNRVTNISADAQINLENSGGSNQQLADLGVQLNIVRSLENYLSQTDQSFGLVPSTLGLKDQTLVDLTTRYNDLQLERQQLLRSANSQNPLVLNVNDHLASLKTSMMENLRNIRKGLLLERNNLLARSSFFESKVRNVPVIERGLLERTREQSVKQSLYHYLLQKREETELSLSATVPTSQVVDRPSYNSVPQSPKTQLIYLCSVIFGFILPAGFIFCKDLLNTKVQNSSEVEMIPGARILGELSHKGMKGSVVIQRGSRTTISELFRYIRSNLSFMNPNNQNQVLLVTSSTKGEGKTFFSINLGITLSMVDKKVVLLEFDLRKPDLLNSLKLKCEAGLSDYLTSDDVLLNDIILSSNVSPNLSVIGCGSLPEDPSELLTTHRVHLLFENLRKSFDYIIIDTPPVGMVADAFSLGLHSDASIYLVRYNFTNKYQLKILHDIYENKSLRNPLVVFNDAKSENKYTYGYGKYAYS
ncbi:GumC family protein [Desertivirga xinjiangensis]|uniref:GumC family protein n=1 Tax=Desertivirga xinjiangensis TaxID=539206 RepID=UPI00210A98B2|nr:tyrosine-protein kinase [Pedobacter xinjiangensis]